MCRVAFVLLTSLTKINFYLISFSGQKNGLKNGTYHVNGHVIEIKDGVRVSSMKHDPATIKQLRDPDPVPYYNNANLYHAPDTYLNNHLNQLLVSDLSNQNTHANHEPNLDPLSQHELHKLGSVGVGTKPLIADVLNDLRYESQLAPKKIIEFDNHNSRQHHHDIDFDDNCSVDSLEEEENGPRGGGGGDKGDRMGEREKEEARKEQKMLRSSLKMTRDGGGLIDSMSARKVTFSDSIEFNDGNIRKLEVQPLERIPLYQRIENKKREELAAKAAAISNTPKHQPTPASISYTSKSSPSVSNTSKSTVNTNSYTSKAVMNGSGKGVNYTTAEDVLDKLREEALMIKTPSVNYPESINAALDNFSQSKKLEKEASKIENEKDEKSVKSNGDGDFHKKNASSYMPKYSAPLELKDIGDADYTTAPNLVSGYNHRNEIINDEDSMNGIISDNYAPGYELMVDSSKMTKQPAAFVPVTTVTITSIHTSTYPISKPITTIHSTSTYKANTNHTSALASCTASYVASVTSVASSAHKQHGQKNGDSSEEVESAVLYVPQYPHFPSKEDRHTTNDGYDGRHIVNYYDDQYVNNYRDMHLNNGFHPAPYPHSTHESPPEATRIAENGVNHHRRSSSENVARDFSLSYINITACDISARPSSQSNGHSKRDNIYKEVERTLAGISFSNQNNNKATTKVDDETNTATNDSQKRERRDSYSRKVDLETAAPNEQAPATDAAAMSNESKISNAIKNGTAIPVRVHANASSNNDGASPARRGRVIVSADKRRRQHIGNMLPHPPEKPKNADKNTDNNKSEKVALPTRRGSLTRDEKVSTKNENNQNNSNSNNNGYSELNGKQKNGLGNNMPANVGKPINGRVSPQRAASKPDYYLEQNGLKSGFSNHNNHHPIENRTDMNNNISKYNSPAANTQPKSYVRVSPNMLPWNKPPQPQPPSGQSPKNNDAQIPLDKTPTDDEINKLWTNVRECIYTEQTEHAFSDSNYVIDNRYHRRQYRRTSSGSSINRRVDAYPPPEDARPSGPRIYTNYTPNYGSNRRYGSHESLNRYTNNSDSFNRYPPQQPNRNDSFGSPAFNKPALLPQRATKIIRNSNSASNDNRYTAFKGSDNLMNGPRFQYDGVSGKYGDGKSLFALIVTIDN